MATAMAWNYKKEGNHQIDHIELIIWEGGLSVLQFDQHKAIINAQNTLFSSSWNFDEGKAFLEETDTLGNNTTKVKKIWMAAPKHLIIPQNLYEEGYANLWVRRFHFLNGDESLFSIPLNPALDAFMVFPVYERWQLFLKDQFKNTKFEALSKIAIQEKANNQDDKTHLHLIAIPKMVIVSLFEKQQFIGHHVYNYEETEELIYKLALLLQEKDLKQEQVKLTVEGIAPFWNNLLPQLEQFFNVEENAFEDTTTMSLDFIKKLYACE